MNKLVEFKEKYHRSAIRDIFCLLFNIFMIILFSIKLSEGFILWYLLIIIIFAIAVGILITDLIVGALFYFMILPQFLELFEIIEVDNKDSAGFDE